MLELNPFENPTTMDKQLLIKVLSPGATVVDATCGNGHDTLFLAEQVGVNGSVYAFDIQADAVKYTEERLQSKGLNAQVNLVQDSHEYLADYIPSSVDCIMFNLGYLPGSDKQIVTEPKSTLTAIESGLKLLRPGGLMTIVIYPGHTTGAKEAQKVKTFLSEADTSDFKVIKIEAVNFTNNPPYLMAVYKQEPV